MDSATHNPKTHVSHHYVPDCLLRNWHSPTHPKKLLQYEWTPRDLDIREYTAKSVAKLNHLYSRKSADGELDVSIEKNYFGPIIDSPAAMVMSKILSNGVSSLNETQRLTWAYFLVAQMVRVPSMLEEFRERAEEDFEQGIDEVSIRSGRTSFREYAENYKATAAHNVSVEMLPDVIRDPRLSTCLLRASWRSIDLKSGGIGLLMGDRPLLRVGPLKGNFLFTLPLSPTTVFCVASYDGSLQKMLDENPKVLAKTLNKDTVVKAERYVYAQDRSNTILIRKYLKNSYAADRTESDLA